MSTKLASGEAGVSTRAFSGRFAVATLLLALILTGCASWCRPKDEIRANIPGPYPPDIADCACTLEYRMNLCVTVNGSEAIPDSLSFLREREDGTLDSLEYNPRCFGELVGIQRILMQRSSTVIDSSGWFTIHTVDCCHGEAKTVDFRR